MMEKFLGRVLNYPWIIMVAILVISALFFKAMTDNSHMETNLDKYMPQEHPAFVYSNQAEEWFSINDGIIIAIENEKEIYNS